MTSSSSAMDRRAFLKIGAATAGAALTAPSAAFFLTRRGRVFPPTVAPSKAKLPNVLLIVLDTVRADHLSCYGHSRETSPSVGR